MFVGVVSNSPSQQSNTLLSTQISNMSAQIRVFGGKTVSAIGYGGMGLSVCYGPVGTDEERLKVAFVFPITTAND